DDGQEGHTLADARTAPDWSSEGKERWRGCAYVTYALAAGLEESTYLCTQTLVLG
ncbi:unnamed protein product, partial [Discosporangium mesarthrocarpum]